MAQGNFFTGSNSGNAGLRIDDDADNVYGVNWITVSDGTLVNNGGGHITIDTSGGATVTSVTLDTTTTGLTVSGGTTETITDAGTFTIAGTLVAVNGGTSFNTYATGDLIYASGTDTLAKLGAGTDTQVLTLAAGVPIWVSPSVGTVTGTGVATSVAFWDTTTSITSDANLYWDNTNDRLGLGTNTPAVLLHVQANTSDEIVRFESTDTTPGADTAPDVVIKSAKQTGGDYLGAFWWYANDDTGVLNSYARVGTIISDSEAGAERGAMFLQVHSTDDAGIVGGSSGLRTFLYLEGGSKTGSPGQVTSNYNAKDIDFRVLAKGTALGGPGGYTIFGDASTGFVGIGTSSPATALEIESGFGQVGAVLTLATKETTVIADDVLGRINFQAPLEASTGDSRLVAGSIHAEATAEFSTTVNATDLVFSTGTSGVATEVMRIAENVVTITSNTDSATESPQLKLYRNSDSPVTNDLVGEVLFEGEDAGGNRVSYAALTGSIADATTATFDGEVEIRVAREGVLFTYANIGRIDTSVRVSHFNPTGSNTDFLISSVGQSQAFRLDASGNKVDMTVPLTINQISESDAALTIVQVAEGGTAAPDFVLFRDNVSPDNGEDCGHIHFKGNHSAEPGEASAGSIDYADIIADTLDVVTGQEDGRITHRIVVGGVMTEALTIRGSGTGEVVINDSGGGVDFRVETNADSSAFFIDASGEFVSSNVTNYIKAQDSATNTVIGNLIVRRQTTATPAAGIGTRIELQTETSASNYEAGVTLDAITTDVTGGSEDFDFAINSMTNGATATEKMRITSTGAIKFNAYDSTNNTGTPTYMLGTDVNGNVVKVLGGDVPGGGGTVTGTGVATRVAFWDTTTSITSDANLYWDNTNDRLGIGTATPASVLEVVGTTTDVALTIVNDKNDAIDETVTLRLQNNNGTNSDFEIVHDAFGHTTMYSNQPDNETNAHIKLTDTPAVVINPNAIDMDFQVASNSVSNMLYVNAGTNRVGVGTNVPSSRLDVRGGLTTEGSVLSISTLETTVDANDVLGRINFQAPLEASGTDAILPGASIHAIATAQFTTTVNATDLAFSTASDGTATEKMRITSSGNVGIGTSTPASMLEILATQDDIAEFRITRTGATTQYLSMMNEGALGGYLTMNSGGTNRKVLRIQSVNDGVGTPGASNEIRFETGLASGPTNRMVISDAADTITIGATTTLISPLDNTFGRLSIGAATVNNPQPSDTSFSFEINAGANAANGGIFSQSIGESTITNDNAGFWLTAGGMNTGSKYTPMLKFGSTDSNAFTTNSPKFLAGIAGRATETYDADDDGKMALEFMTFGTLSAGNFLVGQIYTIKTVGDTDFTLIGAASNDPGVVFTATGVGAGTGTADANSGGPVTRMTVTPAGGVAIGETYSVGNAAALNELLVEGRVGIGTDSPAQDLHIVGSADAIIRLQESVGGVLESGYTEITAFSDSYGAVRVINLTVDESTILDLSAESSGTGPQTIRLFRTANASASDSKFQILNPGTTSETFRVDADTGRVTSAGGGIQATTGDLVAAAGNVTADVNVTAGQFIVGGAAAAPGGITNPGHECYTAEVSVPDGGAIDALDGSHFILAGTANLTPSAIPGQQIWIYGIAGSVITTGAPLGIPGAPNTITLTAAYSSVCLYASAASGPPDTWRVVGDSGAVAYA